MSVDIAPSTRTNWLVLGESLNQGWHATINGHDLGAPHLVDGYANGWIVPPNPNGLGVTVHLEWVPQRVAWVAIWLSLAAGVACLAIVAGSSVRRRRRARTGEPEPALPVATTAITMRPALLERPLARGSARSILVIATLALSAGILVRPWVGVLIGALAFWSIRDRRVRLLIRYAPAAIVGGIAVCMAIAQAIHHYPSGGSWPALFAWERIPIWIALFLLLADALIERKWWSNDEMWAARDSNPKPAD
jgi:arabinofuranan 3-O-arabinosyltransferase